MSKLLDLKLDDFIEKTKDSSSYPGGGALASLANALAGSLMLMVNKLSKGQALEDEGIVDRLIEEAKANIEADARAFDGVLQAMKLPRDSQEEKEAYVKAMEAGYRLAIEVPLKTCQTSLALLEVQASMLKGTSSYGLPDLYGAASLAYSGLEGASYMVDCNLPFLKDQAKKEDYIKEKIRLLTRGRDLKEAIINGK